MNPDVLIVGAAEKSLGAAVWAEMVSGYWEFGEVVTAGISGEDIALDVTRTARIAEVLAEVKPDVLVCTVGTNNPISITDQYFPSYMAESFATNVTGPLELLRHFVKSQIRPERDGTVKKFVAISSNSARIPRTNSAPYCASKAALSMALRCAAREFATAGKVMVWGYEPGMLAGTPMTEHVTSQLTGGRSVHRPMHRMKGVEPEGIPVKDLAQRIVSDLAAFSCGNNGVIYPFDAGEL